MNKLTRICFFVYEIRDTGVKITLVWMMEKTALAIYSIDHWVLQFGY